MACMCLQFKMDGIVSECVSCRNRDPFAGDSYQMVVKKYKPPAPQGVPHQYVLAAQITLANLQFDDLHSEIGGFHQRLRHGT